MRVLSAILLVFMASVALATECDGVLALMARLAAIYPQVPAPRPSENQPSREKLAKVIEREIAAAKKVEHLKKFTPEEIREAYEHLYAQAEFIPHERFESDLRASFADWKSKRVEPGEQVVVLKEKSNKPKSEDWLLRMLSPEWKAFCEGRSPAPVVLEKGDPQFDAKLAALQKAGKPLHFVVVDDAAQSGFHMQRYATDIMEDLQKVHPSAGLKLSYIVPYWGPGALRRLEALRKKGEGSYWWNMGEADPVGKIDIWTPTNAHQPRSMGQVVDSAPSPRVREYIDLRFRTFNKGRDLYDDLDRDALWMSLNHKTGPGLGNVTDAYSGDGYVFWQQLVEEQDRTSEMPVYRREAKP